MRKKDIDEFYILIDRLTEIFPQRKLSDCNGKMIWPEQGVYFFFEKGQFRENGEPRIVRVGTHAVTENSKAILWKRLRCHKGTKNGYGHHRTSVFRDLVGRAIINKERIQINTWKLDRLDKTQKLDEKEVESKVSNVIGDMPFIVLNVPGESGKNNMRAFIETNSIALLSNRDKKQKIDLPTDDWLGYITGHSAVTESGLWNSDDTEKNYNSKIIKIIGDHLRRME